MGVERAALDRAGAMRAPGPLLVVLDEPTASLDAQAEHPTFERYAAAASSYAASVGTVTCSCRIASPPSQGPT